MKDWKQRLYDGYVTTGQANIREEQIISKNPYYDKLIADHLPKNTNLSILDLACGYGKLIYHLKKHGYKNVIGVDISEEQIAAAHRMGITEVKCQDINTFLENSAPKTYDVIFLMDILEHLEKQEIFDLLDKVNHILTDNGIVVIHVPNGAGVFEMRIRYGDFTHQIAFTSRSMQQILQACKFGEVTSFEDKPIIHSLKSFIRYILWLLFTLPLRLLLIAENGTIKQILSQNILIVAKKSPDESNSVNACTLRD